MPLMRKYETFASVLEASRDNPLLRTFHPRTNVFVSSNFPICPKGLDETKCENVTSFFSQNICSFHEMPTKRKRSRHWPLTVHWITSISRRLFSVAGKFPLIPSYHLFLFLSISSYVIRRYNEVTKRKKTFRPAIQFEGYTIVPVTSSRTFKAI